MHRILCSSLALSLALAGLLASGDGVVSAANAAEPAAAAHAIPDISKADLDTAIAAKAVVLIDCNGSDSFAAGHLPGAIDFQANKAKLAELLPKDKNALVVAYCGGPMCGAYKAGYEAAKALGYTQVKHFSGGLSGWKSGGGALVQ
jgi:rhodanese-related sulfurtransferase